MNTPTKFDNMVAEAFEKGKMPVTLEIEDKKVIGLIYGHGEVEFVRDEVRYIVTQINPNILFSQNESGDIGEYEDLILETTIKSIEGKLWKIVLIDNVKQKYQQIVASIVSLKPDLKKTENQEIGFKKTA